MSDALAEASHLQIIFHNDNETPLQFVVELLHSVFDKQFVDAIRLTEAIDKDGQASCGSYSSEDAAGLLETARRRIRAAGHPLRITSKAVTSDNEIFEARCKLCGALGSDNLLSLKGTATPVCDDCMLEITRCLPEVVRGKQFDYAYEALAWHFAGIPRDQLIATSRQFPGHM